MTIRRKVIPLYGHGPEKLQPAFPIDRAENTGREHDFATMIQRKATTRKCLLLNPCKAP